MKLYCFNTRKQQQTGFCAPLSFLRPPFQGRRLIKPTVRVLAASLILGCMLIGTAFAHDPVLNGSLIIDFTGSHGEISPPSPGGEVKITIPNRRHFAGIRIPRHIDGQPFRGQEFTVSIVPSGCVLDGTSSSGQVLLRLTQNLRRQPTTGTTFKATVASGQYECLFGGASQVLPYDPFAGNQQNSVMGELLIWWAQIFSDQNTDGNQSVKDAIHQFFGIDSNHYVNRLQFQAVEYPSAFSPSCNVGSEQIRCNRGGTADGVFTADVRVRFREQHQLQ